MNDIDKLYAEIEALKAGVALLEHGLRQVTPLYWWNPYVYSPPVLTPPTITVSPLTDLPSGNFFFGGSAGGCKTPTFRKLADATSERIKEKLEKPSEKLSLAGQEIPKAEILATAEERWECPSLSPEEDKSSSTLVPGATLFTNKGLEYLPPTYWQEQ